VAQAAFDKKDYKLAMKAAQRVVAIWPLSDFAPQGQYLLGRCYEERRMDEKAFKAYAAVLNKYPKMQNATKSRAANSPSPTDSWPGNGSSFSATSLFGRPGKRRRICMAKLSASALTGLTARWRK